jgi:Ca2+-binding RTX toxin-like protein
MSEVISTPGSTEPIFGLQIFSELPLSVSKEESSEVVARSIGMGDQTFRVFDSLNQDSFSIEAGAGKDVVLTAMGDDLLFGESGNDLLISMEGDDQIFGGLGSDTLRGGAGNDRLYGGAGDDRIVGGAGNDLLIFGEGKDIVIGGSGADRFRLQNPSGKLDKIVDFDPTEDILQIYRKDLPGYGAKGKLTSDEFSNVSDVDQARSGIVYERSSGVVFYKPNRGVEIELVKLAPGLNLEADNIHVI